MWNTHREKHTCMNVDSMCVPHSCKPKRSTYSFINYWPLRSCKIIDWLHQIRQKLCMSTPFLYIEHLRNIEKHFFKNKSSQWCHDDYEWLLGQLYFMADMFVISIYNTHCLDLDYCALIYKAIIFGSLINFMSKSLDDFSISATARTQWITYFYWQFLIYLKVYNWVQIGKAVQSLQKRLNSHFMLNF